MRSTKISVICSLFNSDKYVTKFLENCANQEWNSEIEYIFRACMPSVFVYDKLRKFQESHASTKILITEELESIYQSWNFCLREANGRYIAIWNVDDLRTPNSIRLQADLLDSTSHVSAGGKFVIVNQFGEKKGVNVGVREFPHNEFYRSMLHGPFFMFRNDALESLKGFDEQFTSGSDFDFCVRLANLGPVGFVKENLGYYLNSGEGLSTRKSRRAAFERETIYLRYGAIDKLDITLLAGVRQFDLNRVKILGKWHELDSVTRDLQGIHAANIYEMGLRDWTLKLLRRYFMELRITLLFYIKHPKSQMFNFLRKKNLT